MSYFEKHLFSEPQIEKSPSEDLAMIITIPCFNEISLLQTLDSLQICEPTLHDVEIIIHVNSSETSSESVLEQNQKTIHEFLSWKQETKNEKLTYHLIHSPSLPKKHAGVGLARKIVMDEAAWRFSKIKNLKGVIVCLDADCTVEANYLKEIENHFLAHPDTTGCSVYFEHPVEGTEFDKDVYSSIINYELFLRYYKLGLNYSGFPYPFDTIGSCMAVRADVYMKQGGMNRRQAGEDFYFLHKVFPLENFTEITSTRVIPSPRLSNRVPFGTGADITKQVVNGNETYTTYNPKSFYDLKILFDLIPLFYLDSDETALIQKLPGSIRAFLKQEHFEKKLKELKQHTASQKAFIKRFFKWFDGFKLLKYIHFARDHFHTQVAIANAVHDLLGRIDIPSSFDEKGLLLQLRKMELGENNAISHKNKQEKRQPEANIFPVQN